MVHPLIIVIILGSVVALPNGPPTYNSNNVGKCSSTP